MGYFSRSRGLFIVLCFVLSSLVLVTFPKIDLFVSGLFYAGGFRFEGTWLQKLLREGTTFFVGATVLAVGVAYTANKLLRRRLWGIDGRKVSYLALVLVLGTGLIVNLGLKDNFGRPRPRDVAEFGGHKTFAPAFSMGTACHKNCSFSSGEASAGFFSIALVYAFSRRRRVALVAAIAFGSIISIGRIAAGAHFFSDTVVSYFVMLLLADSLHYYMRLAPPQPEPAPAPASVPLMTMAAASAHRAPVE